MKTSYKIFLDSQLGVREGKLALNTKEGKVDGIMTLLEFDNLIKGEYVGQIYHLRHSLHTMTRELSCNTTFEIVGDELSGIIETENARMKLWGHKIYDEKHLERGAKRECRK